MQIHTQSRRPVSEETNNGFVRVHHLSTIMNKKVQRRNECTGVYCHWHHFSYKRLPTVYDNTFFKDMCSLCSNSWMLLKCSRAKWPSRFYQNMLFFQAQIRLRAYFVPAFSSHSSWKTLWSSLVFVLLTHTGALKYPLTAKQKRISPAFKDVVDLPQQQGHVTELRLPGLAEHLQVLLRNLTGRVEGQRLGCRHDLSGKCVKNCNMRKVLFK